ncbi:gp31 [Escherichia phage phiEB49]|uniref:Gp31 n=1 Tax=Escherichia phage phiEB49 TaxID=1048207 RepID=F8UBU1_9CAUD|nr:anti-repressor [Escherichia phage phiEB49]AEI91231.1 gp31 [Escherichia phage phiEB49]
MMDIIKVDEEMTMTTADIAKIVDVRHDNVMRDVKAMYVELYGEGSAPQFEEQEYHNGKMHNVAVLDKDHTICLVAKYSAKARMNMIKKIKVLERENKLLKEHMAKMVSYDMVLKERLQTNKELAARNRAEDEVYKLEKIIYKYIDKASNGEEVDEKMYELKFDSSRYFDSQELVYSYQSQCEILCQKLNDKDELINKLVDKNSEILKLN